MIQEFNNKIKKAFRFTIYSLIPLAAGSWVGVSCDDFFDQESENVIYTDKDHLNNSVDTVYSVMGILNKLQVIADRTILLGEVRGDLVDLTNDASSDLRDVALFQVGDSNQYNSPRDYYAIINNCNYFIEHVDTALRNNRSELIFMKEYAVVKAIRAWTYMQLAMNYGRVPFVTKPILTKEAAEAAENGEKRDLLEICQYFLDDLSTLPKEYDYTYPDYRKVRGQDSRFFWFPLNILRGDMNLWLGNYREAAKCYYDYIRYRYDSYSIYPTNISMLYWTPGSNTWAGKTIVNGLSVNESYSNNAELITMIPGDSIPAEGYYSQLRNIFSSTTLNDYKPSVTPSKRLFEISEAQPNCVLSANGMSFYYSPLGLPDNQSGDLRLQYFYNVNSNTIRNETTNEFIDYQVISKYHPSGSRNVHIYRKQMVYLRMAEALNLAGYPRMAFMILKKGLTNEVINDDVMPYYPTEADSTFISYFDFDDAYYEVVGTSDVVNLKFTKNTIGMHSRGSGWAPSDTSYVIPNDTIELDAALRAQLIAEQQAVVDSLIVNEEALEFAFEGIRYYDLMRYALRQSNPGETLASFISARRGDSRRSEMEAIRQKLLNQSNWYLQWKGKIGYFPIYLE